MAIEHRVVAILACNDLAQSRDFYERLGFAMVSDYGNYQILDDGLGWGLHLRAAEPGSVNPKHNPAGLYIYVEDVDAVADRVRDSIIETGAPCVKPWGTYEFAVSDPDGALVRVGRRLST